MATDPSYLAGQGLLWVQQQAGTKPEPLTCHGLATVTAPRGDLTTLYCDDPSQINSFVEDGSYQGAPAPVTTTITSSMRNTISWLERMAAKKCRINFFVHKVDCGDKRLFTNYGRGLLLTNALITSRGWDGLVARTEADQTPSLLTFDVSSPTAYEYFIPTVSRVSVAFTEALNAIAAYGFPDCDDPCISPCDALVAAGDATAGSPSDTALAGLSQDEGSTWDAFAAAPFAGAENIASIKAFKIGRDTKRILVARGTTDVAAPAEVAYSDDDGATWTVVEVGTTNGQYAYGPNSLFVLDAYNIWLVTTGGYIYYSDDFGATWEAQEEGVLTAGIYRGIHFSDTDNGYAVAAADVIVKTNDGGATWSAATATGSGDGLNTVAVVDKNHLVVGTDGGDIYYSKDGAETWTLRTFSGSAAGAVPVIRNYGALFLWAIHNTAGNIGRILRSIDGGYTWEVLSDMPASTAVLNDLAICDQNSVFAVGEVGGGTATILKVSP